MPCAPFWLFVGVLDDLSVSSGVLSSLCAGFVLFVHASFGTFAWFVRVPPLGKVFALSVNSLAAALCLVCQGAFFEGKVFILSVDSLVAASLSGCLL